MLVLFQITLFITTMDKNIQLLIKLNKKNLSKIDICEKKLPVYSDKTILRSVSVEACQESIYSTRDWFPFPIYSHFYR